MTPAIRLLKKQKIAHSVHEYDHDPNNTNFGLEASEKLGLSPDTVFKTLLVTDGKAYFVAILPVCHLLNLKKMANAVGVKKLVMANPSDAERLTGYIVGGISPIGQKKRLKTVIHSSAQNLDKMYVSGGKRGLDIGIAPDELAGVLTAQFCDIIDE
ncbi:MULTISPECIES: Cys-tRNA(Pro) deacylase [Moraxella]|uniref:Cys-tRNA(Pro)/Cys-tRNA(Cys) deacylase n=1 Tax=Moraxella lacunata TaxID=477 RepID=A0A1B8PZB4_MORLA|nr:MULTISPECIES: Cys-tRNA(Pro) deacylase [Moraxella]MBE9578295.1 Cys-tRNA(Pro) deacylase [Moraxella sp. K1664]MBE9587381.1 Cys-tRNA(Pro) deacylase [Moraxella sp. K1630]MBE9590324.1 Cys-tRNA(Pro) deacylase [Moraxella sp. K127]MBE9595879.1 Cys-tRNA(Pro) deacylase [Moraxella sp. K2450]MDH9219438.1 Cys-tRNA(Pro) deacylase [Moraxella lacunata]